MLGVHIECGLELVPVYFLLAVSQQPHSADYLFSDGVCIMVLVCKSIEHQPKLDCICDTCMDATMQESNLIATKLLSDAGLHVRMNSPPEAATLMTRAQPGFCQAPSAPSSPAAQEASPAASPTSANDLPLSVPAAIRGSPSECGGHNLTPSMSRASSVGPSGFLATPLSADSLSPTSMVIPSPSVGLCTMGG